MKNNHEIYVQFYKDGQVTVSNLPNEIKSQKYTFTSVDDDKYNRESGQKNLKVKVFYDGLNVEKRFKLQWNDQTVIYVHQDVDNWEEYKEIEVSIDYKDYMIYFVRQETSIKKELFENLIGEIGFIDLLEEYIDLKKEIDMAEPWYITDQSNNAIVRIVNEPLTRINGHKITYYNYNTNNDIRDYKGEMNVERILPICFSGLSKITEWKIEEGVKEIL